MEDIQTLALSPYGAWLDAYQKGLNTQQNCQVLK